MRNKAEKCFNRFREGDSEIFMDNFVTVKSPCMFTYKGKRTKFKDMKLKAAADIAVGIIAGNCIAIACVMLFDLLMPLPLVRFCMLANAISIIVLIFRCVYHKASFCYLIREKIDFRIETNKKRLYATLFEKRSGKSIEIPLFKGAFTVDAIKQDNDIHYQFVGKPHNLFVYFLQLMEVTESQELLSKNIKQVTVSMIVNQNNSEMVAGMEVLFGKIRGGSDD